MKSIEITHTDTAIQEGLKKSMSYTEYRDLTIYQAAHNKTSGTEQTVALINYTLLNSRRMKRWDKTVKISPEVKARITSFSKPMTWLVLSETWCGDAAHILPVLNKIAELNPNINLRIVFRDEHEKLMNQFLTNGSKSIPKLIMLEDSSKKVLNTYGPRPSIATKMVSDYKAEHGKLTPEFKEDLQHWYNKDKGQTVVKDMLNVLQV